MPNDVPPVTTPETTNLEAPMAVWVKGGTTTLSYDLALERDHAEAEARRNAETERQLRVLQNPLERQMHALNLGGRQQYAMVVLGVKYRKDSGMRTYITCELSYQTGPGAGADEMVLCMACPQCTEKLGRHHAHAQFKIHESNRKFWLDTRTRAQRELGPMGCAGELWVNPLDPDEPPITIAGTITTQDWITCPGLGCGWQFKIDDSVVYER